MSRSDPFALDGLQMRTAFERAAVTYDAAAALQREVADQLLERLQMVRIEPKRILDVGCGTGYCTRYLARRYRAEVIGVDIALPMLRQARTRQRWRLFSSRARWIAGDAQRLPLASASVDLIVSNLALQWCEPQIVLAELQRVLRPGGLLMFTTFGPDTLKELRAAWAAVDDLPHVHGFLDMRDLGDLMLHGGFVDPVVDVERTVRYHRDVVEVLRALKRIGAHNVAQARARGLTGRQRFEQFRRAYETMGSADGIPVTYEIVFGHAWGPDATQLARQAQARGDIMIPVSAIRRHRG